MPYLLEDACVRESPDGSMPLLSALVVLKDTGRPPVASSRWRGELRTSGCGTTQSCESGEMKELTNHHSGR